MLYDAIKMYIIIIQISYFPKNDFFEMISLHMIFIVYIKYSALYAFYIYKIYFLRSLLILFNVILILYMKMIIIHKQN